MLQSFIFFSINSNVKHIIYILFIFANINIIIKNLKKRINLFFYMKNNKWILYMWKITIFGLNEILHLRNFSKN